MNNVNFTNSWMRRMFDTVPDRYCLLNKIITFGRDGFWRDKVLDIIEPRDGAKILDICTGTGDLAMRIARRFPGSQVYAVDFSPNMLARARDRASAADVRNVTFIECDCTDMGFADDFFDYVTISFGLRNIAHSRENLDNALKEIRRVLKNGGSLIILETSQPANSFVRSLFHFYAKRIVPKIGAIVARQRGPYAYLGESIVKFFDKRKLTDILTSKGDLTAINAVSFALGMVLLSVFRK